MRRLGAVVAALIVASSTLALAREDAKTLRAAAGDRLLIGAALMSRHLDDPRFASLVAEQFNCLTCENEMKPDFVQPRKGEFTFAAADKIVDFAQKHDMKVIGHTLVWHQQTGKWMFEDDAGKPLPREQALANMRDHLDAVVKHFKGKVIGWDVVNEAISDSGNEYLRDTPARRAIGDDYVVHAFKFAHAADPDVELYYNDYANENPEKRAKTIKLVRELKKAGVRIDAVGLQCHFMLKYAGAPQVVDEAVKAFAKEGVKSMITELDIDPLPRATGGANITDTEKAGVNPHPDGLPKDLEAKQVEMYHKTFEVVKRNPKTITRVTFWGVHDGMSWLNTWPTRGRNNHPLLWDRDLKPKPAFDAVLETLSEK